MNYIIFFLLLLPVKWVMKCLHKSRGKTLVIQTAKIGDFVNITPLLTHLQQSDALLGRVVAPLAENDDTLEHIWYIEDYKTSLAAKFRLALHLMNRYDNVYLLHPNNANLFYAACCNARNKQFIANYRRKGYQALFYATADGIVEHSKTVLTVESYLKLANRNFTKASYLKHATRPLWQMTPLPAALLREDGIKIGISISAGNQAKTIPPAVWQALFTRLSDLPCLFYIFGAPNEQSRLDELLALTGEQENIINMIGQLPLQAVPQAIGKMDTYIASDSGNIYIADAMKVPSVLIYGPCCVEEQRPLGDVLLIGPDHMAPSSFVFDTPPAYRYSAEQMFGLNQRKLDDIHHFISSRLPPRLRQDD